MGRRSRKRGVAPARDVVVAEPRRRGTRPTRAELPRPPWAPFPLVEVCVLIAIVCLVAGFITGGSSGGILIACGLALGSLAGLEVVIREHFAGYKSHSAVLALVPAVLAMAVVFFAEGPPWLVVAAGAPIFVFALWALREAFKRRAGGVGTR